jgi:hypothetical protein
VTFDNDSQLKRIDRKAFWRTGLESIHIPLSVEFIGESCFSGRPPWYGWLREVTFDKDSRLKRIDRKAFWKTKLGSIRIPSKVEFIGEDSFGDCGSLRKVIFDNDSQLKRIDKKAFWKTKLESVRIPSKVEFIGEDSFGDCGSLRKVIFDNDSQLKQIGAKAFVYSPLTSIRIPSSVEFIGEGCFRGTGGEKGSQPHEKYIRGQCFSFCGLSEVTFEKDSQLKQIGAKAFSHTFLESIRIPSKVEFIGERCFEGCGNLSEVIFEGDSQLKEIGAEAFRETGLSKVIIDPGMSRDRQNAGEQDLLRYSNFRKESDDEGKLIFVREE